MKVGKVYLQNYRSGETKQKLLANLLIEEHTKPNTSDQAVLETNPYWNYKLEEVEQNILDRAMN